MFPRTISYCSPMLGLALIFSASIGFSRDSSGLQKGSDDASIGAHRSWRQSLPRCPLWKSRLAEHWPGSGKVEKLRGVLYPGGWECTLMACSSDCCNDCGTTWKFVPRAEMIKKGAKGRSRPILLAGSSSPLGYSTMDCAIEALDRMPLLEVVVSGRLDDENGSRVVDAELCVLEESPPDTVRVPAEPARR